MRAECLSRSLSTAAMCLAHWVPGHPPSSSPAALPNASLTSISRKSRQKSIQGPGKGASLLGLGYEGCSGCRSPNKLQHPLGLSGPNTPRGLKAQEQPQHHPPHVLQQLVGLDQGVDHAGLQGGDAQGVLFSARQWQRCQPHTHTHGRPQPQSLATGANGHPAKGLRSSRGHPCGTHRATEPSSKQGSFCRLRGHGVGRLRRARTMAPHLHKERGRTPYSAPQTLSRLWNTWGEVPLTSKRQLQQRGGKGLGDPEGRGERGGQEDTHPPACTERPSPLTDPPSPPRPHPPCGALCRGRRSAPSIRRSRRRPAAAAAQPFPAGDATSGGAREPLPSASAGGGACCGACWEL